MSRMRFALCNLGCSKNVVDGEYMAGYLRSAGYSITADYASADVILVNTCAFIEAAKREAIDHILELAQYRGTGRCRTLVVCGCFSQRYRAEVAGRFPEVDHWVGVHTWRRDFQRIFALEPSKGLASAGRALSEESAAQYLKIAEGCSHRCSFCAIPLIRGKFASRPYGDLRDEARWLYDRGARELIVVSQDTAHYGRDSGSSLVRLLERLLHDTGFPWIRAMYLHPGFIGDDLLRLVASEPRLCRYFDMPLQHIADPVLRAMRRAPASGAIRALIERIRTVVPGAALRTTFITGFPGETERHFRELLDFIEWARFEKLGAFPFSPEEGTAALSLRPRPRTATAQRRCETLLETQRRISAEKGAARIGSTVRVIVDGPARTPGFSLQGRTQWDAPEVDGHVLVRRGAAKTGEFRDVLVTGADDYDLFA